MEPSYHPSLQSEDYREALARAEANAVAIDETGRETPADQATTEELTDAVPVSASEQPLESEVTETAEVEPVAETPEAPVVEETPEQLRDKIAQLEDRLQEKENMIGRQSTEVGETREMVARMEAELAALKAAQTQSATPAPAPVRPVTEEDIENDPARATIEAFNQKDEATFVRALEAWKDPFTGDPFAAASWLGERRLEAANREHEARIAELNKRFEKLEEPAAKQAAADEWGQAFNIVRAEHADFLAEDPNTPGRSNAERILTEVAPKYPALAKQLGDGTAEEKAEALKVLYDLDRAISNDPAAVQEQLEEAAKEAAAEEAATRQAAAAVSGSPTASQTEAPDLTYEEQEQERYRQRFDGKPSLERGWTGR